MNFKDINIVLKNNTGNKDKDNLIESFVVRLGVFNDIFARVKIANLSNKIDNFLVIGQRGAGKTTLLHRIKYAIEDDENMNLAVIPIMLTEEQYNLLDLINLWEIVAEQLEEHRGFEHLAEQIEKLYDKKIYDEKLAFEILEKALEENNKNVVIFIENFDVFYKKIGTKGQHRLIHVLNTSKKIQLVCSSTTYLESLNNDSELFSKLFTMIRLDGLNTAESKELLLNLAKQRDELDNIEKIIKQNPKRLESLRRLTGGNPRIIAYLFHIFLDNENGKAIIDLYKLLDDITFLYKAELDQLSAQQQKVIDSIARNWDAVSTKEISQKTKIDSKQVSSILNILEKNQVIEIVPTNTKNNLYILKDRFLNIWYLMRFGKKREKENVLWLVRFFDAWCDKTELSERILSHMDKLKSGNYDSIAALDMGNVFLACANVPNDVKYNLYRTTVSVLPKQLVADLKISEDELDKVIRKLIKDKKWDEALIAIEDVKTLKTKLILSSWLYTCKGESELAINSLHDLYNAEPSGEKAEIIGTFYESLYFEKETTELKDKTIYYYTIALNEKNWSAANKLGKFYYRALEDFTNAENYYKIAIDNAVKEATINLAELYFFTNRYSESEELIRAVISDGDLKVKSKLGLILQSQKKYNDAEIYFKEAIQDGNENARFMLSNLYINKENPDFSKAENILKVAVKDGIKFSYRELGRFYYRLDDTKNAEKILLEGVKLKDAESAHLLAHIMDKQENWKKSEDLFVKSIKWGRYSSIMCLARTAYKKNKNESKIKILELFDNHFEKFSKSLVPILTYSTYLLWNDKVEDSLEIINMKLEIILNSLDNSKDEDYKEDLIEGLTEYFILLFARGRFNEAYNLFEANNCRLKDILKPVFYSLMGFMKNEFPNEYLKAGKELEQTIIEINKEIKIKKNKL